MTLSGGALVGAICFGVAVLADLAGRDGQVPAASVDPSGLLAALADLRPWAWALVGSVAIIVTPAVGLVATALEFDSVADRRAALMALSILVVLGLSLLIALLT